MLTIGRLTMTDIYSPPFATGLAIQLRTRDIGSCYPKTIRHGADEWKETDLNVLLGKSFP